jgi:cell division transport system ATP-binding protein
MSESTPSEVIQLKHANIYQQKHLILSDVHLDVHGGEFIFLIGETGSGKSSLLKTLYGELPLTQGEGSIVGYKLRKLKSRRIPFLRRKLGIVFQDFQLLTDRSVIENLLFVMRATGWKNKKEIKERIDEVLHLVGLPTKGFKMPHELSGGEQQRVAIARALINHPELILADEPTGNLDPATSSRILSLLRDISQQGTTVIMATHDYEHMDKFKSRIIVCEKGKLLEKGAVVS